MSSKFLAHLSDDQVSSLFQGLLAKLVDAFEQPVKKMALSRVLLTPYLMGRPLGPVGDARTQRRVLRAALGLLVSADRPTMRHYRHA